MAIPLEISAYNRSRAAGDREICALLAAEIEKGLPKAEAKVWHGHPVWFLEGNPIAGYSKLKGGIRLLFWSGQSFGEPGLAPEGTFKAAEARYVSVDDVDQKALRRWLTKSKTIQWDYKNIVKRRGKLEPLFANDGKTLPVEKNTVTKKQTATGERPAPKKRAATGERPVPHQAIAVEKGAAAKRQPAATKAAAKRQPVAENRAGKKLPAAENRAGKKLPAAEKMPRIFTTSFASVYPLYVQKAVKKGRSGAEVDEVVRWLTGYTKKQLESALAKGLDLETFFDNARLNPKAKLVTGVVCGVRVEDVEDPLMQKIRYLDKLVDELAKGKKMEAILRK